MNEPAASHFACVLLAVTVLGAISLIGYFWTKTKGFGRYNSSVLTVILAICFGAIGLVSGLLPGQAFAGLLMAAVGFAGGMVVGKEQA
ncbi:MAG: hypothetical protein KDI75_07240 [Xanthomonadales bacterium]|nr:hypothetical protein [Xanthomonadales bacterium]